MNLKDLRRALTQAENDHPLSRYGTQVKPPWPVRVRLPDGTLRDLDEVRADTVEIILEVR